MNIIPLKPLLLKEYGIFNSPAVLRKWKCEGKFPEIFLKIGGRLFIDLDKWQEVVNEAKLQRDERVTINLL